jgi:hypothetical protein
MNNQTVTLENIVVNRGRKTSGQSVPFFSGVPRQQLSVAAATMP